MTTVSLHHRVSGAGEPLLMLHGLFGSLENLGSISRLLADQYQIHGLDLRNHGRSPHTDSHSYELMAADVVAYLDQAGLDRVRVVGHSMGGKVAMQLALQYPDRIERVVVLDIAPVDYPPHHDQILAGLRQLDLSQVASRDQADQSLAPFVPELPVRQFLLKNLVKTGPGTYGWRLNLPTLMARYPAILAGQTASQPFPRPVLFLKGGDSDYLQAHYWPQIQRLFPAAVMRIIPHTGHWLHAEKPEVVAAAARRFFLTSPDGGQSA